MAQQVYPATHPDALYAIWDGRPFRAQRSSADGTVLLIAPEGESPEGFDREYEGSPARVVPAEEVPDTFAIHSHCRYADEIFALVGQAPSGELTLQWTGTDPEAARKLGLLSDDDGTSFGIVARPEHVETVWQERLDFSTNTGAVTTDADRDKLLRGIGRTLRNMRPEGAGSVGAQFRQIGGYSELEVRTVLDGVRYALAAPPRLGHLFTQLRAAMVEPELGSWFTGTFTLTPENQFDFDYDGAAEPQWRRPPDSAGRPTAKAFEHELARFPRDRERIPSWLAARAGLPLHVEFQHAELADPRTQQLVVNRPPVPQQEVRGVLNYLYTAPVVLVSTNPPGPLPDVLAPQAPPSVPNAFHTDGVWIWPAAVPHYLRMHGVAPQQELLDHIREHDFQPPPVNPKLRETARAELLKQPYPTQTAADLGVHDPVTKVETDDEVRPVLSASQVFELLEKRLGELGISPQAYNLGEPGSGEAGGNASVNAWCLYHLPAEGGEPPAWQVALHSGERVLRVQRFDDVNAAAAYLLGILAFHPTRALAKPDEAEQPSDWPVHPLPGEPPLNLFRGKRLVVLPAGTELVRFGPDGGNLLHAAGTTFAEAALLPDREQQQSKYRVLRPLRVLTGVALPFGGMPGGGLAYLLPQAVGKHVESGALEKIV